MKKIRRALQGVSHRVFHETQSKAVQSSARQRKAAQCKAKIRRALQGVSHRVFHEAQSSARHSRTRQRNAQHSSELHQTFTKVWMEFARAYIKHKGHTMAIKTLNVKFSGFSPLLLNNPQTVDPFNHYAKLKKPLTSKRSKTDEDLLAIREIEVEGKLFFDDKLGIYVPTRWVMAAIAKNGYALTKIAKAKLRGAVFTTHEKAKLEYDGMKNVKTKKDIAKNDKFVTTLILPMRDVRLAKNFPIFHEWSFEVELEYDDKIVDRRDLKSILEYSAKYGGFGDFRPTYGRAIAEVSDE